MLRGARPTRQPCDQVPLACVLLVESICLLPLCCLATWTCATEVLDAIPCIQVKFTTTATPTPFPSSSYSLSGCSRLRLVCEAPSIPTQVVKEPTHRAREPLATLARELSSLLRPSGILYPLLFHWSSLRLTLVVGFRSKLIPRAALSQQKLPSLAPCRVAILRRAWNAHRNSGHEAASSEVERGFHATCLDHKY